jgi:uncharacterized membrane protein
MYKKYFLIILSLIGLCVSIYLTLKAHDPASVACTLTGCAKVLSSKYASIWGFPVAGLGVIWYIATFILTWFTFFDKKLKEIYFKDWVVIGVLFSAYLLSLEAFVIHDYCQWCLTSCVAIILITFLTFGIQKTNELK